MTPSDAQAATTNSVIVVVAHITSRADTVEATKVALESLIAPTVIEEGCLKYVLHQSTSDPTKFVFIEEWSSATALDNHSASAHLKAFGAAAADLVAEGGVQIDRFTVCKN